MSDLSCHCGKRGALLAKPDGSLVRWHKCREHLDSERIKLDNLKDSTYPPSMPDLFRDTDITRLSQRIQDALDWKPVDDKCGLLFHGLSGLGKTRGLWEIVRRMWEQEAKNDKHLDFKFLTMRKLEGMIEKSFEERKHANTIDSLIETKVLVFDDLGKERLTSRMASDLFAIIDERSTARRITLLSTNFNGTAFLERFESKDKETGVAMIRRFKDYYTIIGIGS